MVPDQFKQGKRDDDHGGGQKQKKFGSPGGPGPDQFKQGKRDNGGSGGPKQKTFGGQGGGRRWPAFKRVAAKAESAPKAIKAAVAGRWRQEVPEAPRKAGMSGP